MNTDNTWDGLESWIQTTAPMLCDAVALPWSSTEWRTLPGLLELLFARERQARSAVDALAVALIRTGTLPESTPANRFWLALRFGCAHDFLGYLKVCDSRGFRPIPEPGTTSNTTTLRSWLLCSIWVHSHDSFLKLYALHLVSGLPFYGLEQQVDSPTSS
jgi:hypothetical protein